MATVDNPSVLNSLSSLNALAGKISPQSNSNSGGDSSSSGSTNDSKQHNGKVAIMERGVKTAAVEHLHESTNISISGSVKQSRWDFWQGMSATNESMTWSSDPQLSAADRDEFLQYFSSFAGTSVLELGAGIGRYTGELGRRARDVIVVDFNQRFLDVNQASHAHLANLSFVCADITKLQLSQARFDVVVSGWMFVNLTRSEAVAIVGQVLGWLRPGGHFLFRENASEILGMPGSYWSPIVLQRLLEAVTLSGYTLAITRCKNSRSFNMSVSSVTEVYYVAQKVPVQTMSSRPTRTDPIPANLPLTTIRDQDLKEAGVRPGSQVLVLGCGSGSLVFHFALTCGAVVLGLMPSMDAINTAIHHHRRLAPDIARLIQFEMRSIEDAEFEDATFDVILVQESEFKTPDPIHLVAQMRRWTNPGGGVFLLDQKTFPGPLPHIEARECMTADFDDVDGEDDENGDHAEEIKRKTRK